MRYALVTVFILFTALGHCLECEPTGPQADQLHCANYNQSPISFGGVAQGQECLFVANATGWDQYAFWGQGLPVKSTCQFDDHTLLIALGNGSYSDGVYKLDLTDPDWLINEWFIFPNFVLRCTGNSKFYVGERDGLFQSENCNSWSRVTAIGSGVCNSFANRGNCIVVNRGTFVYYSHDNGQTWQQSGMGNLKGFRYSSGGVLHGIMDVGSDSDGLWRSLDDGVTWNVVLYGTGITCIGPDFDGHIPLGWSTASTDDSYISLLTPQDQLIPISHPSLNSAVKQMDVFPLVNTPSFYVINGSGCYFLTGFLPVENDDELISPITELRIYPNPAKDFSTVKFSSASPTAYNLQIFNLKGQLLKTISRVTKEQGGLQSMNWDLRLEDGSKAAAGVYFMVLKEQTGICVAKGKMVVVK